MFTHSVSFGSKLPSKFGFYPLNDFCLKQSMASLSISRFAKIVPAKDAIRTWKIKSGDKVIVRCGSHRGKVGKIIQTDHLRNMVRIEGVNTVCFFFIITC